MHKAVLWDLINSLILTAQIFRIYRDVRFSKDLTPYKVSYSLPVS
jgi:uncharacterized protein (DUF2461 family)